MTISRWPHPMNVHRTGDVNSLTLFEERFVARYLQHGDVGLAAREAGSVAKNPRATGNELLHRRRVRDAIDRGTRWMEAR